MLQHNLAQKGLPGAAAILLQGCFVPSCGAEYILSRAGGILMKISWWWGGGSSLHPSLGFHRRYFLLLNLSSALFFSKGIWVCSLWSDQCYFISLPLVPQTSETWGTFCLWRGVCPSLLLPSFLLCVHSRLSLPAQTQALVTF